MASEFPQLLGEFEAFGRNYGENVKALLRDPERKKVADVYAVGLTQALRGLRETLEKQYEEVGREHQEGLDRAAVQHGGLAMLQRANHYVGGGTVANPVALADFGDVFEKIKKILGRILENVNRLLKGLMETIDEIADNLKKLLGDLPEKALEEGGKALDDLKKRVQDELERVRKEGEKMLDDALKRFKGE